MNIPWRAPLIVTKDFSEMLPGSGRPFSSTNGVGLPRLINTSSTVSDLARIYLCWLRSSRRTVVAQRSALGTRPSAVADSILRAQLWRIDMVHCLLGPRFCRDVAWETSSYAEDPPLLSRRRDPTRTARHPQLPRPVLVEAQHLRVA